MIYILTVQDPYDYEADWDITLVTTNRETLEDRLELIKSTGMSNCIVEQWEDDEFRDRTHYEFNTQEYNSRTL